MNAVATKPSLETESIDDYLVVMPGREARRADPGKVATDAQLRATFGASANPEVAAWADPHAFGYVRERALVDGRRVETITVVAIVSIVLVHAGQRQVLDGAHDRALAHDDVLIAGHLGLPIDDIKVTRTLSHAGDLVVTVGSASDLAEPEMAETPTEAAAEGPAETDGPNGRRSERGSKRARPAAATKDLPVVVRYGDATVLLPNSKVSSDALLALNLSERFAWLKIKDGWTAERQPEGIALTRKPVAIYEVEYEGQRFRIEDAQVAEDDVALRQALTGLEGVATAAIERVYLADTQTVRIRAVKRGGTLGAPLAPAHSTALERALASVPCVVNPMLAMGVVIDALHRAGVLDVRALMLAEASMRRAQVRGLCQIARVRAIHSALESAAAASASGAVCHPVQQVSTLDTMPEFVSPPRRYARALRRLERRAGSVGTSACILEHLMLARLSVLAASWPADNAARLQTVAQRLAGARPVPARFVPVGF